MRVAWQSAERTGGNFEGYRQHSTRAREGLAALGATIDHAAPVVVHAITPIAFRPIAGRRNVVLTHWEFDELPAEHAAALNQADLVVVACEWLGGVFRRRLKVPVAVNPLGIDREFTPTRRERPEGDAPFVWLHLAAPNRRKGAHEILTAWARHGWAENPRAQLYLKTTEDSGAGEVHVERNIVHDSRRVSREDLVALMRAAHGFLYASVGEGFGLTLAEAMATGLPAVYCPIGGVRDYALGPAGWAGRPIRRFERAHLPQVDSVKGDVRRFAVDRPLPSSIAAQMRHVVASYGSESERAYRDGRRIHERFTWEAHAERLLDLLRFHVGDALMEAA